MFVCLPSTLAKEAKIGSVAKARQSLENNWDIHMSDIGSPGVSVSSTYS